MSSYKALLKVLMRQNHKEIPNTAGINTWPNPPTPDARLRRSAHWRSFEDGFPDDAEGEANEGIGGSSTPGGIGRDGNINSSGSRSAVYAGSNGGAGGNDGGGNVGSVGRSRGFRSINVDLWVYYWDLAVFHFYSFLRRAEYYIFIITGSYVWYSAVMKVLEWSRFPQHLYTVEICLVVAIPIVVIILILNIMERIFLVKED